MSLRHDVDGWVYDHHVEITSLVNDTGQPLEVWEIRQEIADWCEANCSLVALSHDKYVWFAYECEATMFFLRFS